MAEDVVVRGVWTDEASIDAETARIALDAQQAVAEQGVANVQAVLRQSVRRRTPYYETRIEASRVALDMVVHDNRVRYGPWLEGTSERNRNTSFKGHHAFRLARQELERQVPRLVQDVVRRHIDRTG